MKINIFFKVAKKTTETLQRITNYYVIIFKQLEPLDHDTYNNYIRSITFEKYSS